MSIGAQISEQRPGLTSKKPAIFVVENLTRQRTLAGNIRSADDSVSRRRGLLQSKTLEFGAGLWINPCEAVHTFGMQMALDVVFLDATWRVRKIAADLQPNRIAFCLSAHSVLEVKAGLAAASGLECGDQLSLRRSDQPTASRPLDR